MRSASTNDMVSVLANGLAGNDPITCEGEDFEIFEGENLTAGDLDSLFLGLSIFGENRRILVKNLSFNKELWEKKKIKKMLNRL